MRNYVRKSQRNVDNVLSALEESLAIVSDEVKVAFEKIVSDCRDLINNLLT